MYEEAGNKKKRKAPEAEVKAADSGFLSEHDMQKRSWDDRLVVRRDGTTMILTFLKVESLIVGCVFNGVCLCFVCV